MAPEFMCFPRVIETPIPKKITPNRARFIRPTMSCRRSKVRPVSATSASSTGCPLTSARSVVATSKSFPGRIWRKMSAALALGVSRMSTRTIVRPLRPSGTNFPFCMIVYLVKCRGWHSAGLPPQYMMKSARFLTSPSVHVILPPNWAAISVGPCQSEVWLSTTPPIDSANATASRCASHVMLLRPYTSGMSAS